MTGYKQDDAQLWFKIEDDYDPADYDPELSVSPTTIDFGTVTEGDIVSADFTIKNNAKEDDPFNPPQGLNWNIGSTPSWMSVSPKSGSLDPQETKKVTVEVDTQGMEHKTWSGTIQVTSNGGSKNVQVSLRVPRYKSQYLLFNNLFEILEARFPLLIFP